MSTALSATQHHPIALPQDAEDQGPDWKRQLTERLDAYRSKHPDSNSQPPVANHTLANPRVSKIAQSVASRYAAAPSYSELLVAAAEAEKAAAEAQAALAEREDQDAREAEEEISRDWVNANQREAELAGLTAGDSVQSTVPPDRNDALTGVDERNKLASHYNPVSQAQSATPVMPQFAERSREMHVHQAAPEPEPSLEDLWASSLVEPRAGLPSKLIEFPRELVSVHRSRPRLPEIPESGDEFGAAPPETAQLRIFEVQPEEDLGHAVEAKVSKQETEIPPPAGEPAPQSASNDAMQDIPQDAAKTAGRTAAIAGNIRHVAVNRIEPANVARTAVPIYRRAETAPRAVSNTSSASTARAFKNLEWAAISLDKEPAARNRKLESSVVDCVPFLVDPASIDRRLMAFAVDFAAVTAGFLAFLFVFVASTPHLPTGLTAVALAGVVYASLWVLYQMLFFSLSGATAGMLYARIALCTFDDQNPTRPALRLRLAAWWLSCLPLGIGFLWCFVDEDNLGWHDRMTRMYQREY